MPVLKRHKPAASACAVPSTAAPSNTLTRLSATADPAKIKELTLVNTSPRMALDKELITGALSKTTSQIPVCTAFHECERLRSWRARATACLTRRPRMLEISPTSTSAYVSTHDAE